MDIDNDRATELAFAPISITASTDRGTARAWKGIDWKLLDEMYERGWILNPVGKTKSVVITPEGQLAAERLCTLHLAPLPGVESAIRELEEDMWHGKTRFDAEWLKRYVHLDFVEFGCSGRVYGYESLFSPEATDFDCQLPLPNFKATLIDRSVVLATYDTHVRFGESVEHGHRTSTWIYSGQYWQLRMHQGTPFDPSVLSQQQ